ncbi:MAG: NAD-dependent epimerase/dehydratase family protein, partial [Caulobacterales bacterium]
MAEAPFPERLSIAGASGFVGRRLCPAVRARFPNAKIFAAGRTKPPHFLGDGIKPVVADLLDPTSVAALSALRPDVIVNVAARSSVAQSVGSGAQTLTANLIATLNLATALRERAKGAALSFASSSEVYGASFHGVPLCEDAPFATAQRSRPREGCSGTGAAGHLGRSRTSLRLASVQPHRPWS